MCVQICVATHFERACYFTSNRCVNLYKGSMRMGSTEKQTDFLPDRLFNLMMKCLPIVSAEAMIVKDEGLLLLKRNNEPVKGEWWFPGGRIRRGENLEDALRREIREETGLELGECRLI